MNEIDPIGIALGEDIGDGDTTTQFFIPNGLRALGRIVAKERAVVAGTEAAAEVFRRVNPKLNVEILQADGTGLMGGETVLEVRGAAGSILTAERVALNFLQRLSGIATLTRQFVEAIGKSRAKILDTRKTTPGLRALEKAAVVAGGGSNHRSTLSDMVLVKDNHLSAGSGFSGFVAAVQRLRQEKPGIKIEVEADRLDQVRSFLEVEGIDVILLDNMEPSEMREAVAAGKGKVKFEASGGINLKNVRRIAATGVDFISVGALTHSARAIDFSLELTHVGT
ncbi:MAG TPA: carboxylating nicotinate-nucleotide diphosphorylase [Chthoniobacterales bacterium]|jgi:nicotinate-nucleotide pyrophosphorylase (carboxylating)|nr:carboxylating nicotinate-nucleotide diphosphorylase [Chthoniobacterales bacterium]